MVAPRPSGIKESTLIAILDELTQLESALAELHAAGFTKGQIGFLCRVNRPAGQPRNAGEKRPVSEADANQQSSWGITAGVLPAIGKVVAGGTLSAVLSGAVCGATSIGLLSAFVALGLQVDTARNCISEAVAGKIVLVVYGGARAEWVKSVLRENGATDVRSIFDAIEGDPP